MAEECIEITDELDPHSLDTIVIACPGRDTQIELDEVLCAFGIEFKLPDSITELECRNLAINWPRISPRIEGILNEIMDKLPADRFEIVMMILTGDELDIELLEQLLREFQIFAEDLESIGFIK